MKHHLMHNTKKREPIPARSAILGRHLVALVALLGLVYVCLPAFGDDRQPGSDRQSNENELEAQEIVFSSPLGSAEDSGPAQEKLTPEKKELWVARNLIANGKSGEALFALHSSVEKYPNDPHLRYELANELMYVYLDEGAGENALLDASYHALTAANLATDASEDIDPKFVELVSRIAPRAGATEEFVALLKNVLPRDHTGIFHFYAAKGFASIDDPRAERMFRQATAIGPEVVGVSSFMEWLLERERYVDALALGIGPIRDRFVHFLRGFAFEKLGEEKEAQLEYARFVEMGALPNVPNQFRIPQSTFQKAIWFGELGENGLPTASVMQPSAAVTLSQSLKGLAYLIHGEAKGESTGGRRAAGWLVRNRVWRGAVTSSNQTCPGQTNGGPSVTNLAEKYKLVMCASNQFDGMCRNWCTNQSTTNCPTPLDGIQDVASDVYYGFAPDPVSSHCPGGGTTTISDYCSSSARCTGQTDTYKLRGGLYNLGVTGSCPSDPEGCTVTTSAGKVCANGTNPENCFYRHDHYSSFNPVVRGVCTINTQGSACNSPDIVLTSSDTFYAHLEGPEGRTSSYNFNLYLQKKSSSGSWSDVASSIRQGTVEDIKYSASSGTYRWRVVASQGTGEYTRYSNR